MVVVVAFFINEKSHYSHPILTTHFIPPFIIIIIIIILIQAPEPEVEGVILHVDNDGAPKAILCHGGGSFEKMLNELGEPNTVVEPVSEESGKQEEQMQSQPEAATVS